MDTFTDVRSLNGAQFSHGKTAVGQNIIVSSADRIEGRPAQYRVILNPRLNEVYAVSLRSFTGSITPFNISVPSVFMIVSSLGGGFTHYDNIYFQPGGRKHLMR
jgi:hypothetical protein